ncbi:MAG TPA: hypothetical protein VF342_10035 [Alphaproteobacteria bacterium]
MVVASLSGAQFHINPDGVWLEVESPVGMRAAVNLAELGEGSEVAEIFREWCHWHVARMDAAQD